MSKTWKTLGFKVKIFIFISLQSHRQSSRGSNSGVLGFKTYLFTQQLLVFLFFIWLNNLMAKNFTLKDNYTWYNVLKHMDTIAHKLKFIENTSICSQSIKFSYPLYYFIFIIWHAELPNLIWRLVLVSSDFNLFRSQLQLSNPNLFYQINHHWTN
jgi:hypothetical protein